MILEAESKDTNSRRKKLKIVILSISARLKSAKHTPKSWTRKIIPTPPLSVVWETMTLKTLGLYSGVRGPPLKRWKMYILLNTGHKLQQGRL